MRLETLFSSEGLVQCVLLNRSCPQNTGFYDPVFTIEINELRRDWFYKIY